MILYFDNYITNEPLYHKHEDLDELRLGCSAYKMSSKLDITLYSLASYAEIEWSEVIIKYELEDISQKEKFEKFVKKLFPNTHLIYGRSDSQKKFQETINLMNTFKDDWIFYAGNNDHPFISPNKAQLNICLGKAKELKKKNRWVSMIVTHCSVTSNVTKKGSPLHEINDKDVKLLDENEDCLTVLYPKGNYMGMQIVHKDLLNHWFFSKNAGSRLIRRSEDIEPFSHIRNQVVVIPKKEICAHFDGEIHTKRGGHYISEDISPPLFIPKEFFEKNIKISFGYKEYREGWVNINPLKKKYSFKDKINGTDLMMGLADIPLFWKKRIKKIDVNPKLDKKEIKRSRDKRYLKLMNPLPIKSSLYWLAYRSKLRISRLVYKIPFIGQKIKNLLKNNPFLEKMYRKFL